MKTSTAEYLERIQKIQSEFATGEPHRKNTAEQMIGSSAPVFRALRDPATVPAPKCVQIRISDHCSTACTMCQVHTWEHDKRYDQSRVLSTARIIELFAELARFGVKTVILSGGEPMTHPDLETLLEAAHGEGLRTGILSNGVGISPARAEAIVRHAAWIRISRDDAPEAERRVRHVLSMYRQESGSMDIHREVEVSLQNLARAKSLYPGSSCEVGFAYTIQKRNFREILRMVEYVSTSASTRALGIVVTFKLAHGPGPYLCSEEDLKWLRDNVLSDPEVLSNPQVNLGFLRDHFFRHLQLTDIAEGLPTRTYYSTGHFTCYTPYLFSFIDAFGSVYVCCHLYDDNGPFDSERRQRYRIGDITHQAFSDVWRSDALDRLRQCLRPINVGEMPACSECTRHWVPNTVLTRLHDEIFRPMVEERGFDGALKEYEFLTRHFPDEAIWF